MGAGSWGEGPSLHQLGETLVSQLAAAAPQTVAWTEVSLSAQEAVHQASCCTTCVHCSFFNDPFPPSQEDFIYFIYLILI